MQTIKIYLKESGSVAELVKDFNLYAGSYQNKLLNVYVPTGILYTATGIDNGVKVGGLLTAPNGNQVTTKSYYLNFVRSETVFDEFTQKDIEYAVYERLLPKEFTLFSGNQTIVTNVVTIDNTGDKGIVKQIVTTQTATLVVQESSYLEEEEPIETDLSQELASRVTENESDIYALQERVTTNETNIMSNTQQISRNTQDIYDIKTNSTQPEKYIGQMTGTLLPTQEQLTQFVIYATGKQPENANVVIFILQIEGETDKNYKYIYSNTGWNGYEIPSIETAKNGELGLIEGTFNTSSANNTIVDIVGGQIVNIYVKDITGAYRNVQEYANTLKTSIDDITSGKTKVGSATKAEQDGLGNNLATTYLNKNEGATKNYVQDYALPKQFNDVSYITDGGYSESIPSVSFGATSSAVGSTQLFYIQKTAGAKFQISNKNSYDNVVWVGVSADCRVEFRLTTKIKGEVVNVEVNDNIRLTAGEVSRITFHDTFDYLEENILQVEDNDTIEQILEVITSTSEEIAFTVYSNSIYPSKFYLNTQSMIVKVVEGTIGEQIILGADGVLEENIYNFTVDSPNDYIPYRKNGTEFLVDLNLPIVGELDTTKEIAITFGDTVYYVYNILKGQEHSTIGDLRQVDKYHNQTGYRFITKMTFFENAEITGFAIIPTISMSDVLSLTSDEMDNYIAEGGLTQGQLVICKEVITNGYTEGGLYKFKITYPNIYEFVELSSGRGSVQPLTEEQYIELITNGSVVINGETVVYNDNTLYVTPDTIEERVNNIETTVTEITPDVMRALKTPISAPNETKLVAVDNTNSQEMLTPDDAGFVIENDSLKLKNQDAVVFAENERQKGKNLVDNNNIVWGDIVGSGTIYANSTDYTRTERFIKVKPNTQYTLSFGSNVSVVGLKFYGDSVVSSSLQNGFDVTSSPSTFITPENCNYMKLTIRPIDTSLDITNNKIQIEEGEIATDYQSYNGEVLHENAIGTAWKKAIANTDYVASGKCDYCEIGNIVIVRFDEIQLVENGSHGMLLFSGLPKLIWHTIQPLSSFGDLPTMRVSYTTEGTILIHYSSPTTVSSGGDGYFGYIIGIKE